MINKKDISIGEKVYKLIREINYHENKIFEIVLKIAKASNDSSKILVFIVEII